VNSDGQVDGYGLAVQEQAVRNWYRQEGDELVETYTDPGVSGARDVFDRPGLSALRFVKGHL